MKIIDKINQKLKEGKTFYSFEFFPPRTEEVRDGQRAMAWQRPTYYQGIPQSQHALP